jgi:UDP-N-acetylglucosamine 2-epimerase (non-hydrolysing)
VSFAPDSIAVVLGTRPEIIKLSHIIRRLGPAARVIHTGQHYDPNLSASFFAELSLPEPDLFVEVGGRERGHQIGKATELLDAHFAARRPQAVVVQGDTNAVLAGALAANAREIPLVHIEAGLRSFDRAMPEEHNRVVADHLSDLCCAPTGTNVANLAAEGITGDRVVLTGNTVVEAVTGLLPPPEERHILLAQHGVEAGRFVLSTFHRPENVDELATFETILRELAALPFPVLLPLHPRSVKRAGQFGLEPLLAQLRVIPPIGYRAFLGLEAEAALMISDSGGVQEEASIVKRPVLVVRQSTERPEVLGTFAERVEPGPAIGTAAARILDDPAAVHAYLATRPSPYGDGTASERSIGALSDLLEGGGPTSL